MMYVMMRDGPSLCSLVLVVGGVACTFASSAFTENLRLFDTVISLQSQTAVPLLLLSRLLCATGCFEFQIASYDKNGIP